MDKGTPCPCEGASGHDGLTRRSFLSWLAAGCAGAIGAVLGASGLTYFASPAFKKEEESWVDLGAVTEIKPGVPMKFDYVERRRDGWVVNEKRSSAWVSSPDGKKFTVFDPRCTHLGCPYRWNDAKKQFLCPCHEAVFAPDGSVVSGPPPRPLDQYASKVDQGRLFIQPQPKKGKA